MKLSLLDNAFWLLGFLGNIALLLILVLRRRLKGFPSLTVFVSFQIAYTAALYLISRLGRSHTYFLIYWAGQFGGYPITLWMIVDVIRDVLGPLGMWGRNHPKIFWLVVCLLIALSAYFCLAIGPPNLKGFDLWLSHEEVFTSMVMCALLVAISFLSVYYGLPGRPHAAALFYGLFVNSYVSLVVACVHTAMGWDRPLHVLDDVYNAVYQAILVYWSIVYWNSERQLPPLPPHVVAYMSALHDQVKADLDTLAHSMPSKSVEP